MLTRRERLLLALLPPLAILAVQVFVLAPRVDQRIHAAESKLVEQGAREVAARVALERDNRILALRHEVETLEKTATAAEKRAPELLARWTRPERRAEVVSELSRLFEAHGTRLHSSGSALTGEAPDVPALRGLAKSLHELGGAEPETWRFELTGEFRSLLDVLDALSRTDAFVLPLTIRAAPRETDGRLDVVLWAWI